MHSRVLAPVLIAIAVGSGVVGDSGGTFRSGQWGWHPFDFRHHPSLGVDVVMDLQTPLFAGPGGGPPQGQTVAGEWRLGRGADGDEDQAILWLAQEEDGRLTGRWIGRLGADDLSDLTYEDGRLTFRRMARSANPSTPVRFAGRIMRDRLYGVVSGEEGTRRYQGGRIAAVPAVAGRWEMKVTMGQKEYTGVLVFSRQEGALVGDWVSSWGTHKITDVTFEEPRLSFAWSCIVGQQRWESVFDGKVDGHALSGVFRGQDADIPAKGERMGASLVGWWEFTLGPESGMPRQLLRVYPDLSGRYGTLPVEHVNVQGPIVEFAAQAGSAEPPVQYSFTGRLEGATLSGDLTDPQGARRAVKAYRIVSPSGQRVQDKTVWREPDVIFVPTPQHVVDKMLELAQVTKDDLVYDLGCGDGRIVVTAALDYGCRGVGYDISDERVKESLENVKKHGVGDLVWIEQADIFTLDLSEADVVTLYLLPTLNVKLIPQLEQLKPGSRIVSHDFDMAGVKPDTVVYVDGVQEGDRSHTVYLWTTPLKKESGK